ncbi:MAG: putative endonuclease [Flavobacteriales bacterium]|jgi:putative endonuclease
MPANNKSPNRASIGAKAEAEARRYLEKSGLIFITANESCKHGEIDLIMKDKDTYVFVEVRYRKHAQFGGALESITPSKQEKVRRSALYYLQKQKLYEKHPIRFDVVAMQAEECTWLQGAF